MLSKLKKIIWIILFFPIIAFANGWEMETSWPISPVGTKLSAETNIGELVAYFYEWGVTIGIILFFGIIVFSGIKMIASTGDPSKYNKAKEGLKSSSLGVLVLLGSFLILNTINPDLTEIERLIPKDIGVGHQEFQKGNYSGENFCEFAFVTTQEDKEEKGTERTHFMIPGMEIPTEDVFPKRSYACVPEKDESKIMEVRENETGRYMVLVTRQDGKEVKHEDPNKENRAYRYLNDNKEGVLIDRDDEVFLSDAQNWCDKVCKNINCSGPHDLCDQNIAAKIHNEKIEISEYISALEESSFTYFDGYLNDRSRLIHYYLTNSKYGVAEIQSVVFTDMINGIYKKNNDYREELNEINSKRYEEITYDLENDKPNPYIVKDEENISDFLMRLKRRKSYNIFEDCETIIAHPEFDRPRCLQIEKKENNIEVREWKRIGYASLTQAWEAIGNKNKLEKISVCPDAKRIASSASNNDYIDQTDQEVMENLLGYERKDGGGGCTLALYDGEVREWSWGGKKLPTCTNKISQPSADMDSFQGMTDRESTCMQLIRHEPQTTNLIHTVEFDRTNITDYEKYGFLYMCEGFLESYEKRENCQQIFDRTCREDCEEKEFEVLEGKYTVLIRNKNPDARLIFEDSSGCQELGDINKNTAQTDCLIEIKEDADFTVIEDKSGFSDPITIESKWINVVTNRFFMEAGRADVDYRYNHKEERWEYRQLSVPLISPGAAWADVEEINSLLKVFGFTFKQTDIARDLEDKNEEDGIDYLENLDSEDLDKLETKEYEPPKDAFLATNPYEGSFRFNYNTNRWEGSWGQPLLNVRGDDNVRYFARKLVSVRKESAGKNILENLESRIIEINIEEETENK